MDNTEQLGTLPVGSLLAKFAVPAIVGLLVHASYNIADRYFVGSACGEAGLAGLTLANPLMSIQFGLAILLGVGAATTVSIRLGEGRLRDADRVLGSVITLSFVLSAVVTAATLAGIEPLLSLFGTSDAAYPHARGYIEIIFGGTVVFTLAFVLSFVIRAVGDPKTSMYLLIASSVLNIVLDPLFIMVLGMGAQGAALATIISSAASAAWGFVYLLRKKCVLTVRREDLMPRRAAVRDILALGTSACLMEVALGVQGGVVNAQLQAYGGDTAVAAMGIVFAVIIVVILPVFGICDGNQPILGYNHGAGRPDRVQRTLLLSIAWATGITTVSSIVVLAVPGLLAKPFCGGDPGLLAASENALRITFLAIPVAGGQIVGSRYYQSVGKPVLATLLGLSRQVLLLIPLALVLPRFFGLDGVWGAGPVADVIAAAVTGVFVWRELLRLRSLRTSSADTGDGAPVGTDAREAVVAR